jgi:TonB family protein
MIFTVRAIFFEEAPITQSAVQVDLVDLPDKLTNTMAAAPEPEPVAPPEPQPENPKTSVTLPPVVKNKVIEKEAINLDSKHKLDPKKDKEKQNQALNKLKQLNAIDALQNEKPKPTANTNPTPHKGNIISAGSAGMSGVGQLMADSYKAQVDQHFRARWALPQYLRNKNLEAQVLVKFDEKGYITLKEIVVSSGNPVFDELVLSTIEKSSPVPTPPARIAQESSVRGYTFRFRE